ncbi:PepSY domain-containing protein [Paracraurococcus lichenis]|uniref:PepSY domain-containing protein n=1 Tax=Paracraurococcus lichenis TaxID=3064888 RepID=A0ABT9DZB7_9PROT|nr:PepSY domain-containing protein [Paracraurococcus sp. LOR1-02]MDO9709236.1 PepSY domain-containing protein [Paracraurococcus sp. LOR1-02]
MIPVRRPATLLLALLLAGPALAQQQERADPAWLTADQVRTVLRARGYTELGSLQREGDTYRVMEAIRYGEKVPDLRIDALTGLPREQPPLTEGQARSLLLERGYTGVEEVGREGETIRLRASQSGTPVEVRVNARTGTVTR